MRYSGCSISLSLCISSWGMFIGCLTLDLPHVMHYEVVAPQLNARFKRSFPSQQTYPEEVQYSLAIEGLNYTLHLEKNRNLVGKHYSLTHYTEDGTEVTIAPDHEDHCYYQGHILGMEDSSVSVGLCSGIKGFVRAQQQVFLIEPLGGDVNGTERVAFDADGVELHAVYRHEHLRRKRSSCSYGNNHTFYDHGSRPSGLYQHSGLKSEAQTKAQTGKQRFVEMVLVVDNSVYKKIGSKKLVEARMLEVANHVDKLYRPLGLRVMLVGLEIWSYKDQIEVSSNPELTLTRFLQWRQGSLQQRTKHDNAQLVTAVDFEGSTVGLATASSMCSPTSGGVNEDHNPNPVGVASTITHEMGHNLGMFHDTSRCSCGRSGSSRGCIMAESVGLMYPELFSSCSQQHLSSFLEEVNPACLLDTPPIDRIYGGPVCGNAFQEPGEECDCGTVEECRNTCCNASTCTFTTGAQCAEGECCHNCQLRQTGSVCRPSAGDCDLTEYCSGLSPTCPPDAYTQNGLSCNHENGYCYNGQCPSHTQHCKRLWGADAEVASKACFYQKSLDKQCRKTLYGYQRCPPQDMMCGKLFCTGGWEFPVTSRKSIATLPGGVTCNIATMDPKDPSEDLGMVPTGTKCGNNMVCYDQRCQDIKVYGTRDCSDKCNSHGVCNHERQCQCDHGWAPPYCDMKLSVLAAGSNAVVTGVSLAVALLLLLTLVIGGLLCCRSHRQKQLPKWQLRSTSGQSNPLFQSGNSWGRPLPETPSISHPTFVESSATQACKPICLSAVKSPCQPLTVAVVPNRLAPQVVRPSMLPPVVPGKVTHLEAKPLPPSRPLPPLSTKLVTKPKPPIPPMKPVGIPSVWKHTQLAAGKAALKPPSRPK